MAQLPSLLVSAVTTFDGKALRKGEKQIGGLTKTVKNLAGALGIAFSAAAIVNFGKLAVKAALDQQAEQNRLNQLLKVGVGATSDQIALLNEQTKALEKVGVVTGGNITQTQSQLATFNLQISTIKTLTPAILDYVTAEKGATASTADFKSMTNGLAQALNGNFASLTKVGFVLDENTKKQIKSGTETERAEALVKVLNSTYKDFNKNLRDTDAGQMQVLSNAAQNATTIIGTGLLDALKAVGKDKSIDGLASSMESAALATADFIRGLGQIGTFNISGKNKNIFKTISEELGKSFSAGPIGMITRLGEKSRVGTGGGFGQGAPAEFQAGINARKAAAAAKAEAKARAAALKLEKERLALTKKFTVAEKNKLSLSKAAAVFDSTRISLAAALKSTFDKETRLRLEALQAIEEDNGDLAIKKINELGALQRNADLMKLAGITEISNATLAGLNTQLLKELEVINGSKMAEADKELARQDAFGKYNSAIKLAGTLALAESYSERVQIQLTEIARLASLSKTTGASNTLALLRQTVELQVINTIAAAQKLADDNRLAALKTYLALLGGVGGGGGGSSGIPMGDFIAPVSTAGASIDAILEFADAATARANAFADLLDLQNIADQKALNQYLITINAGVIADPLAFTGLVQDTIQRINRGGDPLTTAGIL